LPEPVARTRVEVHRSFSTGAFAEVTGNVQTLLHRAPRSFAEFARDYASVFRRRVALDLTKLPGLLALADEVVEWAKVYWHKVNMLLELSDVRFRGQSGH
jgi:hypothetical protein